MKPEKLSLDEHMDELLMQAAALSYVEQEKDALHNEILEAHKHESLQPSADSIREIKRAYRKYHAKKRIRKIARRMAYFAASLFVIAAASFSICYATVDAFRARVSSFFTRSTVEYTEISTSSLSLSADWDGYPVPLYIPTGYSVESDFVIEGNGGSIDFSNGKQEFSYSFYPIELASNIKIDSENTNHQIIEIQGKSADLYQKEGYTTLVFKDDHFAYVISGNISQEDVVQIAKSIAVKK